jgi:hypothetical protein
MKNKNNKHHRHYVTVHQRLERLAHHRIVLTVILAFMALSYIKYETQLVQMLHDAYAHGFSMIGAYAHHEAPHHEEVTRMPVQYGSGMRSTSISGE